MTVPPPLKPPASERSQSAQQPPRDRKQARTAIQKPTHGRREPVVHDDEAASQRPGPKDLIPEASQCLGLSRFAEHQRRDKASPASSRGALTIPVESFMGL
jgi:hypothetical protein